MIINTGQRTDIPAFYSKWFMRRIKEGFVLVRNPYYPTQVTKFLLNPRVVDVIGFCTKNPRPMIPYLDELKEFGQFWYITITGFGKDLEPNVPPIDEVIKDFETISEKVGANAIGFRYTPIIINDKYTLEYHIKTFERVARELRGYTHLCAFGFLDIYPKLAKIHPELKDASDVDKITIAKEFAKIAKENDIELRLCSKEKWLKDYGINTEGCMLLKDYEKAINKNLKPTTKMQARKSYCACFLSNDIGTYNSCMHLCHYCYANGNEEEIRRNFKKHDDESPFLIGSLEKDDKVVEAKQESWIDETITLF